MNIKEQLNLLAEPEYAAFEAKLCPTLPKDCFLGVRVPNLRKIENEFRKTEDGAEFLKSLPHETYDENLLHSIFIANLKGYDNVMTALEAFLPYVDNWAVCDTLRPNEFKKHKDGLMEKIRGWIASEETYTCRFGIDMLMTYYLDEDFCVEYLELPAGVHSEEYYVRMMVAWYYATALSKHWEETVPYLENGRLDTWVHNKTIQKAIESYRITEEQKAYLRTLKR